MSVPTEALYSVAEILVDDPLSQREERSSFTYLIPPGMPLQVGALVVVPFGRKMRQGIVLALKQSPAPEFKLKAVHSVLIPRIFPEGYLELLRWVGDFYLSDLFSVVHGALPLSLLANSSERIQLLDVEIPESELTPSQRKIVTILNQSRGRSMSLTSLKKRAQLPTLNRLLKQLEDMGLLQRLYQLSPRRGFRSTTAPDISLEGFAAEAEVLPPTVKLNAEQEVACRVILEALPRGVYQEFLLHGATGSGKTEIYFKVMRRVLERDKQVIFLVPEIALSVQLLRRMQKSFPDCEIVLWHSNLSEGQRLYSWQRCLAGGPLIVLGVRSAIFAPVADLGLVVIDEEHDSSFKSGNRPFYDARMVAQKRSQLASAALVKGSATPNVSSYHRAAQNDTLLTVKSRFYSANMPKVEIVDMRRELHDGNRSVFSRKLRAALEECFARKEQAILLLNRRGHSSYVFCRDCGYACFCEDCSVPLIYHLAGDLLRCHQCDRCYPLPNRCPHCHSSRIKQSGLGTQQLEQTVREQFPEVQVIRLDRDISGRQKALQSVWSQLIQHNEQSEVARAQVLVGTQLVAKGIDLPKVTLVGVMHAESGLYLPDYTSSERTFQLLTQAAGRAGRHQWPGMVIFQTFQPEHPLLRLASEHDYQGFYRRELLERSTHGFPPFRQLVRFIFSHPQQVQAQSDAIKLSKLIRQRFPHLELLGPASCPLGKLRKLFRWHFLLKLDDLSTLSGLRESLRAVQLSSRLSIDVQPLSLM